MQSSFLKQVGINAKLVMRRGFCVNANKEGAGSSFVLNKAGFEKVWR